jgi:hypothetical protein
MKVLRPMADHGYPADYFFARIRGRRAIPDTGKRGGIEAEQATARPFEEDFIWLGLQGELLWSFRQMNGVLRNIFQPFFIFMELRNIMLCLRYKSAARPDRTQKVLQASLLAGEIREPLQRNTEVKEAVRRIAGCFSIELQKDIAQRETTETGFLREFERKLFVFSLQRAVNPPAFPAIAAFFRCLIDIRNLLTIAKGQRWVIDERAALPAGGFITPNRLSAAPDLSDTASAAIRLSGTWASGLQFSGYRQLEVALHKRLGTVLRKKSRFGGGIDLTLDYLWQCCLAARNRTLLNQAGYLPAALVEEELVQ